MADLMRCNIDLDWCTYKCPCGDHICTRNLDDCYIGLWLQGHKSHTNGKVLEHTTADGQRAWGGPVPDELVDYPKGGQP